MTLNPTRVLKEKISYTAFFIGLLVLDIGGSTLLTFLIRLEYQEFESYKDSLLETIWAYCRLILAIIVLVLFLTWALRESKNILMELIRGKHHDGSGEAIVSRVACDKTICKYFLHGECASLRVRVKNLICTSMVVLDGIESPDQYYTFCDSSSCTDRDGCEAHVVDIIQGRCLISERRRPSGRV